MRGKKRHLLIIGTGGLAREVSLVAAKINAKLGCWDQIGFISQASEEVGRQLEGGPVVGTDEWLRSASLDAELALGIGTPQIKARVLEKFHGNPFRWPNLIDPDAVVNSEVIELGQGNVIAAGTIMSCSVRIGSFNLFNWNATVGHDVTIGNSCVINPAVNISGGVRLGDRVLCGVGCQILEQLAIGNDVTIGAGAVVLGDVPDGQTVVGVPARRVAGRSS